MGISFLYPLIWIGALAVAVPIWLHLRRRDETDLVRFSAMRFLDDQPLARSRPFWPRDWPLMLLRLLALLLIVAAFAWPYRPDDERILINESRVYILDNTLSHQTADKFQAARDQIAEELAGSSRDQQIAVIELKSEANVVVSFSDDRQSAAEVVRKLEPSHQRGSYLEAFRTANRLLSQSLGETKRIVFLTDSQQNQWSEGSRTPPFLQNIDIEINEIAEPTLTNVAVTNPIVRRAFIGDKAVAECAFTIFHQGDIETVNIAMQSNGKDVVRRELPLKGEPASFTLAAQWVVDPTDWLRGEIVVENENDPLPADNRVVFSMPPVREGNVAVLSDSTFLKTALSPDIMRGRWKSRNLDASNPQFEDSDDVICVESHFLQSNAARDLVRDNLNAGKGVILFIDRVTPLISGFLRELHIEANSNASVEKTSQFRYIFMEHPIFLPFRSPDFGDLLGVRVKRYRRLKVTDAIPLVFTDAGDPVMLQAARGKGKLFVFAFALNRQETNWPLHPTFIPFLDLCLQQARSQLTVPTDYHPGEICVWKVADRSNATEVVLKKGVGSLFRPVVNEQQTGPPEKETRPLFSTAVTNGQAEFRVPDQPGLYALSYNDDEEIESLISVNPSPKESELSFLAEPEALAMWKRERNDEKQNADASRISLALSKPEILRQRIWWWLLLAGMLALFFETSWVSFRKDRA